MDMQVYPGDKKLRRHVIFKIFKDSVKELIQKLKTKILKIKT